MGANRKSRRDKLSGLNALVVTEAAAAERAAEIGAGLAASVIGSAGQLCTKPGLVLIPASATGDAVVDAAAQGLEGADVVPLLNERIHAPYLAGPGRLRGPGSVHSGRRRRRARWLPGGSVAGLRRGEPPVGAGAR